MADEATIQGETFYKSLAKLEALAGIEQQAAPQESDNLQKSQICTGPSSEKKQWAGSKWEDVPGNGPGADKIKPDGTDYNERGVRKSIMEKVDKGMPLTADELSLLKSDLDKGAMPPADTMGKAKNDEKEKEEYAREMNKSLGGAVEENDTLRKGIEVSSFLSELAKAFGAGLQGLEARMESRLADVQNNMANVFTQFAGEQGEFNKSLAEAVVNIGHGVGSAINTAEQAAQMPVGPPKSHLQVVQGGQGGQPEVMQKSFAGPAGGQEISKSMMLDTMHSMLESKQINPLDIIKFDSTGDINPALQAKVINHIQTGNR